MWKEIEISAFIKLKSQEEKKKEQSDQNIWRNNGPEFTKIKEKCNIWDCKVS